MTRKKEDMAEGINPLTFFHGPLFKRFSV